MISGSSFLPLRNDINITASRDSYEFDSTSKSYQQNLTLSTTLAGGAGSAIDNALNALAFSLGIGQSKSESSVKQINYNNSRLNALNGELNLSSGNDTVIEGGNLLGRDVVLDVDGDLTVASLQNSYNQKSKTKGFNFGGGSGGVSLGFNQSRSSSDRLWVDNQSSIIGTNSVNVDVVGNTGLKGAVIANVSNAGSLGVGGVGGGLNLAYQNINSETLKGAVDGGNLALTTGSLTVEELKDYYYTESTGFGVGTSFGVGIGAGSGPVNPNQGNPNQQLDFYPSGSTSVNVQNSSTKKEGVTKSTIGLGTITVGGDSNDNNPVLANLNRNINQTQEITKDQVTGALDLSTTIDNRIFDVIYEIASGERQDILNDSSLTQEQKDARIAGLSGSQLARESWTDLGENLGKTTKAQVKLPTEILDTGIYAGLSVYDYFTPSNITDPKIRSEIRTQIRQAALTGDKSVLRRKVKELTGKTPASDDLKAIIELTESRDFAQLQEDIGGINYRRFLDKYTVQTGVFFDGTNNRKDRDYSEDPTKDRSTNVARMRDLYGSDSRVYVKGVGTESDDVKNTSFRDKICQATGCGITQNQKEAIDKIFKKYNQNKDILFFPLDIVGFSRGGSTASDFINKIDNENYWNLGILTRSALLFDPVGSYGVAGNGTDLGRDFSLPSNIIAIQINAKNEKRDNFPLQSLSNSDGSLNGKHWTEITLPGVHSTIGSGYPEGEQEKTQDIGFYAMERMINEAGKYGIKFKDAPQNQKPSQEFNQLMDYYLRARENYANNPTNENKSRLNSIEGLIKDIAVHDSSYRGTGEFQNYTFFGSDRNRYYPNENRKD